MAFKQAYNALECTFRFDIGTSANYAKMPVKSAKIGQNLLWSYCTICFVPLINA